MNPDGQTRRIISQPTVSITVTDPPQEPRVPRRTLLKHLGLYLSSTLSMILGVNILFSSLWIGWRLVGVLIYSISLLAYVLLVFQRVTQKKEWIG